jgi:hypothetical protein
VLVRRPTVFTSRVFRGLPRRSPLRWALALLVTLGCWGALFAGLLSARSGVGLMFAGGWTLSLLPVHSARFRPRPARGAARGAALPPVRLSRTGASRTEAAVRAWWGEIQRLRRER